MKFEGTKNDEGQSGTICSANNGKGSQTNYNNTAYDISIGETTEGAQARNTIDDITTKEITQGEKPRNLKGT